MNEQRIERTPVKRYGPVVVSTVEGEPIQVRERELVPVVRLTTGVRRRATFGTQSTSAWGTGLARLQPVAIIERGEAGERRIPIQDETDRALLGLLVAALAIPLLLAVAVRLLCRISS